jgi:hypothetical protein
VGKKFQVCGNVVAANLIQGRPARVTPFARALAALRRFKRRRTTRGRGSPETGRGRNLQSEAHRGGDRDENCTHETSIVAGMARYTLVYGLRLVPEGALERSDDVRLYLKGGDSTGLTLHTIDGTIPQLRRALDRSLDAFFDFLPGATDEDKRQFED